MQVWVNSDDEPNVAALAGALQQAVKRHSGKKLLAFVVFMNPRSEPATSVARRLEKIARDGRIEKIALAYLSGPDDPAVRLYGINRDSRVRNTVFVYKNNRVAGKLVNLAADRRGLERLDGAIQKIVR